ncbi:hypothetical protein F511_36884 [Dorcoceras hygrometricum]|uniref:Uncharacterized protein n=1 Tax=Dorcoceras hygrometricum TaxID=472368 RepID=A0A2Z7B8K1_9LAMI|nr:hypothetical protein F511_36884 [Dorcoceras hygrometricum]
MQHAIINAMKCMRAIKDQIARPVYQLAIISIEPLYHAQQVSRWKSSIRDLHDPSAHHSSGVFRHDKSVGHHSDDSVGLFSHDKSVGQSQRGSQSGFTLKANFHPNYQLEGFLSDAVVSSNKVILCGINAIQAAEQFNQSVEIKAVRTSELFLEVWSNFSYVSPSSTREGFH